MRKFIVHILTDCVVRHDNHHICVWCKDINKCSKCRIAHLHALKMGMQFTMEKIKSGRSRLIIHVTQYRGFKQLKLEHKLSSDVIKHPSPLDWKT